MNNQNVKIPVSICIKRVLSLVFSILLCVGLCVSFSNCSGDNELSKVRKELKSYSWIYKDSGWGTTEIFSFENDGQYTSIFYVGSNTSNTVTSEGTYVVEEDEIIMTNSEGNNFSIEYSFEDGNLELTRENFKLIKSN